ncbi:hypothetical protein [Pseudomonas gingeri]|uniref:Lipoprotein n=1 Tax=Pseudomonas gingeri TaxID=117681 RepID=A0A7Y8CLZ2_9PSED|nr:hypothetical protein [Pseudomonas gingeri]NWA03807.1 hypothetical protein [Pseudomonas gingeri]NWA14666.1 hypothetical protein [Pseudomonas gingeri]NWA58794.1 hypothetical protein [Pseudomonas gingeri]NWA94440.1 hypothetical protein [Pseudomonas gingeri]NWB01096.1 hypothetical protein [Pseudomonas gingeri]
MPKRMSAVLLGLFVSLSGCAKDYSLAPPPDSEQITVTVKVPKELEAETMNVMYRSSICKRITRGASGQRIELDGYRNVDMQPQRQGQSDLYEAKLPIDGGGKCQWRLSNVIFGVVYSNPTYFGENVTYGAGGGVVVMFDRNNSPRGGSGIKVDGDLTIKKDYYPWISEDFLGPYRKTVSLAGEGSIYVKYRALQARQVYFEPVLHSDFVLYSAGPKVKKKGNYTTFTYPDGSVFADGRWHPNFLRLQAIRLAAQGKQ